MTATNVYSDLFTSATSSTPLQGRPKSSAEGFGADSVVYTVATTSSDEIADFVGLIPVPSGKRILFLAWENAALDSNTVLDMDIILRTTDSAGTNTDTVLYNAGTALAGALTDQHYIVDSVLVPDSANGSGIIGLYVNTAGTSADAGDIRLFAMWN